MTYQNVMHRALVALLLLSTSLAAQDSTTRGVRIGLTYDPGSRPGVVVLPGRGAGADSIRAILQRDLDYGDRVSVIVLDASASAEADRATAPNWALFAKLGAAAAVQATPTATGIHLAVYDIAKQTTALVRDYTGPAMSDARAWRAMVHGMSDDLEEAFTGTRGVARTRILFERDKRLWVVDSDGQQVVAVTGSASWPQSGAWHPNGRSVTFSNIMPAQINVLDLDGGRVRTIASGSGTYMSPVFTPDGSGVLYGHGVDNGVDLFLTPSAGGTPRRVTVGNGSDNTSPSFSPDGNRVTFMSGRAGHPEIYTIDADGTNTDLLTPLEFGENAYRGNPDWSPDGRTVVFQSRVGSTFQLLSINLRDRGLKQLTSDGKNEEPTWAPDGRHLAFSSNRSGTKQLWILDVETGRTRQLTRGSPARNGAWSPRLAN